MTKWVCAQQLRSVWASAQSDQYSLCAQRVAEDLSFLHADSEDPDQTGRIPRLIWVFAGRTVTLLVLSWRSLSAEFYPMIDVNVWKQMSRDMTKPTKWLCAQRRLRSAWAPSLMKSSLSAWRKLGSLATYWAYSEGSDQTGRMPRLILVFAGRTLILLVLSCRGSNLDCYKLVFGLALTYRVNVMVGCVEA